MRGLYAITDVATLVVRGLDIVEFVTAVLLAHPVALQLRAKNMAAGDVEALLRKLSPMCRRAGVPLFANDLPEAALAAGCDGVHVGQSDASVAYVRHAAPGLQVGVSTHTMQQLDLALSERPTYVAFGPVFATSSKAAPDAVVGVEGLRAARARANAAGIPLVAIGGITRPRADELVPLVDAIAVIGALVPSSSGPNAPAGIERFHDVTARAHSLQTLFAPERAAGGQRFSAGAAR